MGGRRRNGHHLPGRADRVPGELYDAAEVDGASVWRKVWHVTMPQLRGVLFITLILQIIGTAQVFLEPFLFTNGGPNHATETIMLRVYNLAFASLGNNFGAGDRAEPACWRLPGRLVAGLLPGDAILEPVVTIDRRHVVRTRSPARHVGAGAPAASGGDDPSARGVHGTTPSAARSRLRLAPPTGQVHLAHHAFRPAGAVVLWCLGPLLLLAKFAFTPTQDILTKPMALFPHGPTLHNIEQALDRYHIGQFFLNTVWVAVGSWFIQVLVATTGGFVLSVLRPRWARVLHWAVLVTLFVPAMVLLDPALQDHRRPTDRTEPHQQLPGGVAAGRRDCVQRRAGHAVLRLAAAGDLRGRHGRRRRAAAPVLSRSCCR